MKIKRILVLACIGALQSSVQAQSDCSMDLRLLKHLMDTKKMEESLILSSFMLKEQKCHTYDSVYFLRGFAFYQLQQLDSATNYLLKVSMPDTLYNKARFFALITSLYKDKPQLSDSIAQTIKQTSQVIADLKKLCRAGISLYQRDRNKYRTYINESNTSNYLIANEINGLENTSKWFEQKRKSPVKAAILSAVIPGSGKWYLGRKGQAITSFLTVGILSAIATEVIIKNGWTNFYSVSAI
ncbi:MAG: hypothetical protein ACP5PS_01710, partial [Bacteroidales bacterium]